MAIVLTQLPLILFLGAKFDLVFGFNRMDSGFTVLLLLFLAVPMLNLTWLAVEIIRSARFSGRESKAVTIGMPLVAAFFLLEAVAVDLYIASHARM